MYHSSNKGWQIYGGKAPADDPPNTAVAFKMVHGLTDVARTTNKVEIWPDSF